MEMTIDTIIKDCEQSIKQSELFIKAHQKNMEIGEIKEYQYYIERDKLTADILRKYQQIKNIICKWEDGIYDDEGLCHTEVLEKISDEVNGDGKID
jgi:hypothetical protein